MILILEDDTDREAYQRGSPFREGFYQESESYRVPTVWISPKAYAQDVVLADLREQIRALRTYAVPGPLALVDRADVLALLDGGVQ